MQSADFIWIDNEHTPMSYEALSAHIFAAHNREQHARRPPSLGLPAGSCLPVRHVSRQVLHSEHSIHKSNRRSWDELSWIFLWRLPRRRCRRARPRAGPEQQRCGRRDWQLGVVEDKILSLFVP